MSISTMHDLLIHQLRDLYSAERQILLVLPQLTERCTSRALADALTHHRVETALHVVRLEEALRSLAALPHGVRCRGMELILLDALTNAREQHDPALRDAGIIVDCQRTAGYALAVYATARVFAESLGHAQVAEVLQRTLDEVEASDAALAAIAQFEVRPALIASALRAPPPEVVGSIIPAPTGPRLVRITV